MYYLLFIFLINLTNFASTLKENYSPDWSSLDKHPLPDWYDRLKIGIFIHWGVWSVPAAGFPESAFLWYYINQNQTDALNYMSKNYASGYKYPEFAADFKAEFFEPTKWLDIFNSSGAKYIVFVSKHHDGYSMWPSAHSWNWNSMDIGPKRDLLGELISTIRKTSDIKIGLYYSLFEFYNTLYLSDKSSNFTKKQYIESKMIPQLKELVNQYKPEYIWADGDWETDSNYFESKEFLAWLYTNSPVAETVLVNDRWGTDASCKHGDVNTCTDRYNPRVYQGKKWENAMTLDLNSWGFRKNYELNDVIKIEKLIEEIVTTVSCGGNVLINVGPTSQGTIEPIFEERLRQMGKWLEVNGEAIYNTIPWFIQNDTLNENEVWYTCRFTNLGFNSQLLELYAISLKWPSLLTSYDTLNSNIKLNASVECSKINTISFLGYNPRDKTSLNDFELKFSCLNDDAYMIVIDLENINPLNSLSQFSWVFKIYLVF